MKKSKRMIAALLAAMLSVSVVLGGCGQKAKEEEQSDTLRWINASYAVLTELNGQDYTRFGGMSPTESNAKMMQNSLEEWWGVTDRQSADETLDWILTEGHRTGFAEQGAYIEGLEIEELAEEEWTSYIQYCFETDEDNAQYLVDMYRLYAEHGANAIDAWDYCRALNLLSFYYIAGYYTEEEAMDKSLEIAKDFQAKYQSWDELVDSYMYGYEYWAEESSEQRRQVYEDLKSRKDNPYAVDYNTTLEKTW